MNGIILLFYKYVHIQYPKQIQKWLRLLCTRLGLKGRIIIAHEGVNATVGGPKEATEAFKKEFLNHPLFGETDMKESDGTAEDFPRLSVKIRTEVVSLGVDPDKLTTKNTGVHLTPEQTHKIIDEKKDLLILDTRNDYETRIGKFNGAVIPDIKNFREFPEYVDKHIDEFKDKEVLMYCTGGIRCERATAYLKEKGVAKEVYQIEGGICRYVEQYPDGHFRGKNYVFDDRIAVPVNNDILTNCDLCSTPADTYTNCVNTLCNKHFVACQGCRDAYGYTCSLACQGLVKKGAVRERHDKVGVIQR